MNKMLQTRISHPMENPKTSEANTYIIDNGCRYNCMTQKRAKCNFLQHVEIWFFLEQVDHVIFNFLMKQNIK